MVNETKDREMASLIARMSSQSVGDIDQLVQGLQGVRKKLVDEGDRLQREAGEYAAFSQSVTELTKIVSEGMMFIKARTETGHAEHTASPSVSPVV